MLNFSISKFISWLKFKKSTNFINEKKNQDKSKSDLIWIKSRVEEDSIESLWLQCKNPHDYVKIYTQADRHVVATAGVLAQKLHTT